MEVQHYFDLLREIRDTAMATVAEDGTPRIRIIDTMLVKDEKLYFLTARGKEFYRELMQTGQVAVTGLNARWETVRLEGKVKNIGHEYLNEIFDKNPSMNSVYPGDSREILEVFCLYEGQGEYFCLADHPIVRKSFCLNHKSCGIYSFAHTPDVKYQTLSEKNNRHRDTHNPSFGLF